MKEKNPIEPLTDQIAEFLRIFDENKHKKLEGELSPEILDAYQILYAKVLAAGRAYFIALKEVGLTDEEVIAGMKKRDQMPVKDRQLLERLEKMGREARLYSNALQRGLDNARRKASVTGNVIEGSAETPKKKLGIGFRKGWKRM